MCFFRSAVCSTAPTAPANGAYTGCSTTSVAGSTCTATCATNYGPSLTTGAPTVTCTAVQGSTDGVWSTAVGECVPGAVVTRSTLSMLNKIHCCISLTACFVVLLPAVVCAVCLGQPTPNPTNGQAWNCPVNSVSGYTCSATCASGYSGPVTSTCTDGTWGTVQGTCKRGRCVHTCSRSMNCRLTTSAYTTQPPDLCAVCLCGRFVLAVCSASPPTPSNGAYATGSCPAGSLEGKTCTATCSATYSASKTAGAPTTSCLSSGSWATLSGSCLKSKCSIF